MDFRKILSETTDEERFFFGDTHEPLIDRDTFEAAQKRLATRTRNQKRSKKIDLFSGLMYCADCEKKIAIPTEARMQRNPPPKAAH